MTLDKSDAQGTHFVDSNENGSADTGTAPAATSSSSSSELENVSGVALTDVVVDDPLLGGPLGLPDGGDANGILDPGEVWGWSRNYFITADDATNVEQRRRGPQRRDRDGARSYEQCRDGDGRMGPVLPIRSAVGPRLAHRRGTRLRHRRNGGPSAAVLPCGPALPLQRARRRSEFVPARPPSSVWLRLMSLPG